MNSCFKLMPTLEWCLTESSPIKPLLYNQISQLIRYWSKNRQNSDYKSYSYLVEQFWTQLESTFINLVGSSKENFDTVYVSNLHDSLLDLLLSLKNTAIINRKNLRVKFFDPEKKQTDRSSDVVSNVANDDPMYNSELTQLINKVTSMYFTNIQKDACGSNIWQNFYKLVANFESKELFVAVSKSFKDDTSLFEFYNTSLKKWLVEEPEHIELVITLIFSLIKYLDKPEKDAVLASLTEVIISILFNRRNK